MKTVAVISFPGNNCEVETIRTLKRSGLAPTVWRWNVDVSQKELPDAYILPGGFSYEDRVRSGLIASRQPIFQHLKSEAKAGKPVIGICNGAQMLIESGMIPLGDQIGMSLADNIQYESGHISYPGFINEWLWMKTSCSLSRCPVSNWSGVMQLPIAHAEGRFTTKDPVVIDLLQKNDQIVFSYCSQSGDISPEYTPNGSLFDIAGICNPAGNVVAVMPHPERSKDGDIFFNSLRDWLVHGKSATYSKKEISLQNSSHNLSKYRYKNDVQVFIDTKIINNEERTLEKALRTSASSVVLTQMRFYDIAESALGHILASFSYFNNNKEVAYIKRGENMYRWDHDDKLEILLEESPIDNETVFMKQHDPDTTPAIFGETAQSGICYSIEHDPNQDLTSKYVLSLFSNPHSSTLQVL